MLISYFDLIPKSLQEVKLVPPKPEIGWHTSHYEIVETHSYYYIKKITLMTSFVHLPLNKYQT